MKRSTSLIDGLKREIDALREAGTFKVEHEIEGPQGVSVEVDGRPVIMLTSNNYLGLANHPRVRAAAREAIDEWGYGMASVRFICGTGTPHLALERRIADFFEVDDAILFGSCWNANEALFAAILSEEDAVFSDELNHASIIDGIRLCKAERYRYAHNSPDALGEMLDHDDSRHRVVVTDGVFSMEGEMARLPALLELCRQHGALLVVDDSHATGVLGERGRGTAEELGVHGEVDITTGTLGKALGGAAGGFVAGPRAIVDTLRQRSRPYLFSNSLPPMIVSGSLTAFDLLDESAELVERLRANTKYFRAELKARGFDVPDGVHPIVPVIVGETALAIRMSKELLDEGVYVSGFGYPVVPKGEARLRAQVSAAHSRDELEAAIDAIERIGARHGVGATGTR
ncbi:MAG TPA: glycine C-acetyltransferase [Gemmatimonadota bacterium]|nr:glycine C-acetyltransferase [Gemmatimonadota bacterium]